MTEPAPRSKARQFGGFVLVGAFAAAMNWGSRFLFSALGAPLSLAVVLAYLVGMAVAFVLMRLFVFERTHRAVHSEASRFLLVNLVSLLQVWGVTLLLARLVFPAMSWSWHAEELAHAAGVASPILTSYFAHRYFTFGARHG